MDRQNNGKTQSTLEVAHGVIIGLVLALALALVGLAFFEGFTRFLLELSQVLLGTAAVVIALIALKDSRATARALERTAESTTMSAAADRATAEHLERAAASLESVVTNTRTALTGGVVSQIARCASGLQSIAFNFEHNAGPWDVSLTDMAITVVGFTVSETRDLAQECKRLGPEIDSLGHQVEMFTRSVPGHLEDYKKRIPDPVYWRVIRKHLAGSLLFALETLDKLTRKVEGASEITVSAEQIGRLRIIARDGG